MGRIRLVKPSDRLVRVAAIVLLVSLFSSTLLAQGGRVVDLPREVEALGLDPDSILAPLVLTPEAEEWVRQKVSRGAPEVRRLEILLDSLQHSSEFQFQYGSGYTGTVQEVFETGNYNCLSFSMLFVSLARAVGLPAYYLKVDQVEDYEKDGDLVVLSRHITAGYGFVKDRTILEFDLGPEISYNLARPISDLEALGLYYSNRGGELLRQGKNREAMPLLEIAVTLGPKTSQNWVNLGVAQRRTADLDGAEVSYLRALEVEKGSPAAFHNMVALLRLRGERDAAGEILQQLVHRKNRNPFTYLALGDLSLAENRVDDAQGFFRRALNLAKFEAETHAAMGQWALAANKRGKAETWLERASEIDPESPRVIDLRRGLYPEQFPAEEPADGATTPADEDVGMPTLRASPEPEEEAEGDTPEGGDYPVSSTLLDTVG